LNSPGPDPRLAGSPNTPHVLSGRQPGGGEDGESLLARSPRSVKPVAFTGPKRNCAGIAHWWIVKVQGIVIRGTRLESPYATTTGVPGGDKVAPSLG